MNNYKKDQLNFGIEYYPGLDKYLLDLYETGVIDHVQITVPSFSFCSRQVLQKIKKHKIPIILHSNILNPLGVNDFSDLELFSEVCNSLEPIYIIEHFTLFREEEGHKNAISTTNTLNDELVEKNILKYKKLFSTEVLLENTPITEDVFKYYKALVDISEKTDVRLNIDIPHLMISLASLKNDNSRLELIELLVNCKRVQHTHICGVSLKDGIITDSHSGDFNEAYNFREEYFSEIPVTWEQSYKIKKRETLVRMLNRGREVCKIDFDKIFDSSVESIDQTNYNITLKNRARFIYLFPNIKFNLPNKNDKESFFYYFYKYIPFVDFKFNFKELGVREVIKISKCVCNFNSWILPLNVKFEHQGTRIQLSEGQRIGTPKVCSLNSQSLLILG